MAWSREAEQKSALCCVVLEQETLELRDWAHSHSPARCLSNYWVYSQGFFHVPSGASACSAHIPISKLTAAPTDLVHLGWTKISPSAPKSQPSSCFPHSTQTLQPCLAEIGVFSCFLLPIIPNFLFVSSCSQKSPCQICPSTCSWESPSSSCSVLVTSVRWKARKC